MKKNFKKTISIMKSADQLILEREGDSVYICNGHVIVQIPHVVYVTEFCPSSPRFRVLNDGEYAQARGKRNLPELVENGHQLKKLMDDYKPKGTATDSKIMFDGSDGMIKRIYISDDHKIMIVIREMYHDMMREMCGYTNAYKVGCVNERNPLMLRGDYGAIMVLPVNNTTMFDLPFEDLANWQKRDTRE